MENIKFDFNDILIKPNMVNEYNSRNDIHPMYDDLEIYKKKAFHYPIFTAPMSSVVNEKNKKVFKSLNIPVVLPRTVKTNNLSSVSDFTFFSFGLNEFENTYCIESNNVVPKYALIDIANGHLTKKILELVKKAKENYEYLTIMIGNVANPETYRIYAISGIIDYVRIGIGNGNGCLTTQQTGIGYPMASLINECNIIKNEIKNSIDEDWESYKKYGNSVLNVKKPKLKKEYLSKIVADGGMKDYSDIIKALALGADYVMIGSLFNKALESAGDNYLYNLKIKPKLAKNLYDLGFPIKKQFYGMSTKLAQKKLGKNVLKTSEGVIRYRKIEYSLENWISNFDHYLRSAMSYSNAKTLNDFIGKVEFNLITNNSFNRFKK